jgi:hypothetical protein
MFGECVADHGSRTLDYRTRERGAIPTVAAWQCLSPEICQGAVRWSSRASRPDEDSPTTPTLVCLLVCRLSSTPRPGRRRIRGRSRGCRGRRGPRPSEYGLLITRIALQRPSRMVPIDSTFPAGVLAGVARGGHGPGDHLTLAARSEPTPLEEGKEAPTSSSCLT